MRILRGTVLIFAAGMVGTAAEPAIGVVKSARGEVVLLRETKPAPLTEGLRLLVGDIIRTQPGATAGIILLDGTRLAIGEKTELKLSDFQFEPSARKYGLILQVLNGILVYVSGKIARFSPGSVEIRTPAGIVGTRGTSVAMKIEAVTP
jgi:hypothetical protein